MSTGSWCPFKAFTISTSSSLRGRRDSTLASVRKVEAAKTSCDCCSSTSQIVTDNAWKMSVTAFTETWHKSAWFTHEAEASVNRRHTVR